MSKTFKIVGNDISDGYHTFDELYDHRYLLYMALCMSCGPENVYYVEEHYEGWFLLVMNNPIHGQISYHLPNIHLPKVKKHFRKVLVQDHVWDGHTSNDVLGRLGGWLNE